MLVTTTNAFEGRRITGYLGVVTREAILGASIIRDFFADVREIAFEDMEEAASELGADAIVGVDIDGETGRMLILRGGHAGEARLIPGQDNRCRPGLNSVSSAVERLCL